MTTDGRIRESKPRTTSLARLRRPDTTNNIFLWAQIEYNNYRSTSSRETEQSVDSGHGYVPSTNQQVNSLNRGHETQFETTGNWTHLFKDGSLKIAGGLTYTDSKSKQWFDRTITDYSSNNSSALSQHAIEPSSKFRLNGSMTYQQYGLSIGL